MSIEAHSPRPNWCKSNYDWLVETELEINDRFKVHHANHPNPPLYSCVNLVVIRNLGSCTQAEGSQNEYSYIRKKLELTNLSLRQSDHLGREVWTIKWDKNKVRGEIQRRKSLGIKVTNMRMNLQ